jgi:hypothetical protein
MNTYRRTFCTVVLLAAALLVGASSAWAGGYRHHGCYHGHGGHHGHRAYSSVRWGVGWSYPAPYWRAYPYYPAPRPYYGPAYGPAGGVVSIGYGTGAHHSSWGFGLSFPLYLGPRYAPPPPVAAPAMQTTQTAPRQARNDCLQLREYQTEIVVGGRTVPAYGDACLQPDGSWKKISGPFATDY